MLFRERLKHQVQQKKCDLCSKRNQVHLGDSGGEIEPGHNRDGFCSNGISGHCVHWLWILMECELASMVTEHRDLYSGMRVPLWHRLLCKKNRFIRDNLHITVKWCWSLSLLSPAAVDKPESIIAAAFQLKWNLPETCLWHLQLASEQNYEQVAVWLPKITGLALWSCSNTKFELLFVFLLLKMSLGWVQKNSSACKRKGCAKCAWTETCLLCLFLVATW